MVQYYKNIELTISNNIYFGTLDLFAANVRSFTTKMEHGAVHSCGNRTNHDGGAVL